MDCPGCRGPVRPCVFRIPRLRGRLQRNRRLGPDVDHFEPGAHPDQLSSDAHINRLRSNAPRRPDAQADHLRSVAHVHADHAHSDAHPAHSHPDANFPAATVKTTPGNHWPPAPAPIPLARRNERRAMVSLSPTSSTSPPSGATLSIWITASPSRLRRDCSAADRLNQRTAISYKSILQPTDRRRQRTAALPVVSRPYACPGDTDVHGSVRC
jgi:hypothetical protein